MLTLSGCPIAQLLFRQFKTSVYQFYVSDGRCFLVAWDVSTSLIALKHDRPKPNLPKRKDIHPFRCLARVC